MNVDTMMLAFRCSRARAESSVVGMNQAMILAKITNPRRAAMWCGQWGHETLSLYYDQEVWGPTAAQRGYEGRKDLGNTEPGDGYRFRGRGRCQLTGRVNYGAFSRWAHDKGLVPTADHFVRFPDLVAQAPWRDLAASWYWTVARSTLNAKADAGDVTACTRLINGGTNGLADRQDRYNGALRLGNALLPTGGAAPAAPASPKGLPEMIERALVTGLNEGRIVCPTGSASGIVAQSWASVSLAGGGRVQMWFQKGARSDAAAPGAGQPVDWTIWNAERPWVEVPSGTEFVEYRITSDGPGSLLIEQKAR